MVFEPNSASPRVVFGAYEIVRLWLTFALDDISGGGGKVWRGQSSWEVAGGQKGLGFDNFS